MRNFPHFSTLHPINYGSVLITFVSCSRGRFSSGENPILRFFVSNLVKVYEFSTDVDRQLFSHNITEMVLPR